MSNASQTPHDCLLDMVFVSSSGGGLSRKLTQRLVGRYCSSSVRAGVSMSLTCYRYLLQHTDSLGLLLGTQAPVMTPNGVNVLLFCLHWWAGEAGAQGCVLIKLVTFIIGHSVVTSSPQLCSQHDPHPGQAHAASGHLGLPPVKRQ